VRAQLPTRVAERWFEARDVAPGVTLIVEPHVHVWMRSNCWLVRGRERDLLVDAANGIAPLRPFVDEVRGRADKPLVAVVTHAHTDHMGGLHEFDERVAHLLEAPDLVAVRDRPALLTARLTQEYIAALAAGEETVPDAFVDALPSVGYDLAAYDVFPAPPTHLVEESDVVGLGDRVFRVLHLPGHTHGSIGLWEGETGTLFSGDTVYRDDVLLDELPTSNIADYVATMRRLRELPARIVHGGHDPSFGRDRLIERCDEYLARRASESGPSSSVPGANA